VRRDLPWRRTRDPWAVLVSEVMLQQTQVARVVPAWRSFLERWPTVSALAAAELADVLVAWQGLGYPRRARALWALARRVEAEHGGAIPSDPVALLALPGVGPYTARAVLAFAFEADGVGVLDTNTARVLARAVAGRRMARSEAQALADALSPPGGSWWWNQAMLDLGALHCAPARPRCATCPLLTTCRWVASGGPDPATGSAGVSVRQAPFRGSDRQVRGAILRALGAGPLRGDELEAAVRPVCDDPRRVVRLLDALAADGLVRIDLDVAQGRSGGGLTARLGH
jgi:A/G-specific adenine glycosylase